MVVLGAQPVTAGTECRIDFQDLAQALLVLFRGKAV